MVWLSAGLGLALLLGGTELLLRGAVRVAVLLHVPWVVIGVTVAAYAGLLPEVAFSANAAVSEEGSIALSALMGANLASLALVVGLAALRGVADVSRELIRREIPALVGLHVLLAAALLDGVIGRIDGLVLLAVGGMYTILLLRDAVDGRRDDDDGVEPRSRGRDDLVVELALVVVGVAMVLGGSWFAVDGVIGVADALGVPARLAGIVVIGVGLRAQDAVAALLAPAEPSGVVGAAISASLLTAGVGTGLVAVVQPIAPADPHVWRDVAAAGVLASLWIPLVLRGGSLTRLEGALLVAGFLGYLSWPLIA